MILGRALYLPEWGITSVFDLVVVFVLEAKGTPPASEPWGRLQITRRARGTSPQRVHLSRTNACDHSVDKKLPRHVKHLLPAFHDRSLPELSTAIKGLSYARPPGHATF
ncbi:hypothetical protein CBL_04261 [Carabus blaptoides fortunei]